MSVTMDLRTVLMTIGVSVAILSLIWSVSLYLGQKRRRVLVAYSLENGFRYRDNPSAAKINVIPHYALMTIINAGSHSVVIDHPVMQISRKVQGNREWILFEGGEEEIESELKPGEKLEKHYDVDRLVQGVVKELKNRDTLRFIVQDTTGRTYRSKALRVRKLREFARRPLEKSY